jgi:hypothetical protein
VGVEVGASYLAATAVAAGNGGALARSGRLVVLLLDVLWRRALLAVRVVRRRGACPLVGAWQAVLLLVLRVLVGGHVRARLLGRGRREGRVHLARAMSAGGGRLMLWQHCRQLIAAEPGLGDEVWMRCEGVPVARVVC